MGQLVQQAIDALTTAVAAEEQQVANDAVAAYKATEPQPSPTPGNAPVSQDPVAVDPNIYTQAQFDAYKSQCDQQVAAQKVVSDAQINALTKHNEFLTHKVDMVAKDYQDAVAIFSRMQTDLAAEEEVAPTGEQAAG